MPGISEDLFHEYGVLNGEAAQEFVESAQHIPQQTKAKITCCFCGSPCVSIRGESEWVKCRKCGELHRK